MSERIPVIAVVGPTASGKSTLAVELALKYGGEIISADSMQVYKGYDISTAKPTEEEKKGVPHYLMDDIDTGTAFCVADYVTLAREAINLVFYKHGKLPVVCGGTGLYVDSLLNNIDFCDEPHDTELRRRLNSLYESSPEGLLSQLMEIDAPAAEQLHVNNKGRIIRALEVYYKTGLTPTQARIRSKMKPSPYDVIYIGICFENRQLLYDRIEMRVDQMIKNGLLEEAVFYLDADTSATSAQSIGCKELKEYLLGNISLDAAVEELKKQTRHYAKRQMTWFRRNSNIHWIIRDGMSDEQVVSAACDYIDNMKGLTEIEQSNQIRN